MITPAGNGSPVAASSIALILNGQPVTNDISITITDDETLVTYDGLGDRVIYSARLTASTEAGAPFIHEWRFDTFSTEDLSSPGSFVIEAENYNFENGQFLTEAGPGTYADKFGEMDVDYFDFDASSRGELRFEDFVETRALLLDSQPEEIVVDTIRPGVDPDDDYVVSRTEGGEWLNYTRAVDPADYFIYLRAASRVPQDVLVDLVTDATIPNQTLQPVGKFPIQSTVSAQSFEYFQMTDDAGNPTTVPLGGEQTLRLTIGGDEGAFETKYALFMNYVLLLPASGSSQVFAIKSAHRRTSPDPQFEIIWNSIPGYNYSVEYGSSPDALILELEDLVAEDSVTTFTDQDGERMIHPSGFYRVQERR